MQINKIRNEKGDITTDTEEIQTTSYFENLYSTKFENSKEMDKFLDNYHLRKLKQEQTNYINRPITPLKSNSHRKPSNQKSPGQDGFNAEFYQKFKEELIPIVLKLFHTIETEGTASTKLFLQGHYHLGTQTSQRHN